MDDAAVDVVQKILYNAQDPIASGQREPTRNMCFSCGARREVDFVFKDSKREMEIACYLVCR